jgi:rubrerythrin
VEVNVTPEFASTTSVKSFEEKLSLSELVRAIRFSVAAEYETVQTYEQIVEASDNDLVKKVVGDIIAEGRLHAGQFLDILFTLSPDEKTIYDKGAVDNKKLHQEPEAPKPRNALLP